MRWRRAACLKAAALPLLAAAIPMAFAVPQAQEREDRTLLSSDQMRAIINEASGERAGSSDHVTYMQHGIPAVMFIT